MEELINGSSLLERGQRSDLKKSLTSIFYILSQGCCSSDLPEGGRYAAKTTSLLA